MGEHTAQSHLVIADGITFFASLMSALGWIMGWLPGVVSLAVGIVALCWYVIQIHESQFYRRWKQRRHRHKMRRHRLTAARPLPLTCR